MVTENQKKKILQIINVFETGVPGGKYDSVTRLFDGPGKIRQITYGRSQTTEYGNLKRLIEKYSQLNGTLSQSFIPYISKIGIRALVDDATFIGLLKDAGRNDPVMKKCQDDFFDLYYYLPAISWADGFGFKEALSMLVIYDSFIHSGQVRKDLRQLFAETPPSKGGREKVWIEEYVKVRHNWLKNHSLKILNKTIYRTQCFKDQIANSNWDLSQPVSANGTILI
jgi:chitosanase